MLVSLWVTGALQAQAQTATTAPSGIVINKYTNVTNISGAALSVGSSADFSAGNRVVIMQMQGASVSTSDSASHGDLSSYGSAGLFEYGIVVSSGSGTVTLQDPVSASFNTAGKVQLIRVQKYTSQTLTGTLTAQAWNGTTGGVVAIDATGTLTINATVDVTGKGFRGGALAAVTPYDGCGSDQFNYTGPVQNGTGNKGEGIAVPSSSHAARRGHRANGGGGGNITDAGGGGGSNVGAGGIGGRELDLCDNDGHYGGLGGQALDYSSGTRLFMGGGGGSGSEVSQASTGGSRSGGGIILIRARTLNLSGATIRADGLSAQADNENGADGGGGAGAIAISVTDALTGLPTLSAQGGDGGDEANTYYAHGTGGGGGGGAIRLNGATCSDVTPSVAGGDAGVSTLGTSFGDANWGATDGQAGNCLGNFSAMPEVPFDYDFTDAPRSGTSYSFAYHHIVPNTYRLGATVTGDATYYDSPNADGDVDDGVTIPPLTQGLAATIGVSVEQPSAGSGYLQGWIDWDRDGSFEAGEQVASDLQFTSGTSGTISIPVTVPATASTLQTFARFRWSATAGIGATGYATSGEVEDYAIIIASAPGTAFPAGPGLANSLCNSAATTNAYADLGMNWNYNGSGGTDPNATIDRTDLFASATPATVAGGLAMAINYSKIDLDADQIPASYDPSKYIQYQFTTANFSGISAELRGIGKGHFDQPSGGDISTGSYRLAVAIDDDPAFGSPEVLIHEAAVIPDASGADVASAPSNGGTYIYTFGHFDASGTTVALAPNTTYTVRLYPYAVSAYGLAYDQSFANTVLFDDFHLKATSCAPGQLAGSKSVAVYDPSASGTYAIPGNDVVYTITVSNTGGGAIDQDTVFLVDAIPATIEFFNGATPEFGGAALGWSESSSGLSFDPSTDAKFSDQATKPANLAACTYSPAAGYDPSVRYLCLNPKGAMASGDPDPEFSISFRARIK